MKRKSAVYFSLISILLSTLISCGSKQTEEEQTETKKPLNILFIPVDDLRPELGCYGNEYVISPNIDELAARGVVFNRAYCQQAVCNPSRASLLTGLRPDSIKVWDLRTYFRDNLPDIVTLPQYFKNHGYEVVGIGKMFHNNIPDTISWTEKHYIDGFPFDPDAVYLLEENLKLVEEKKQKIIEAGLQDKYIDPLGEWYIKTVVTEMADVPDNAYFDGAQTDWAIERMKQLKDSDKPFFLAVGYYRPHLPFNAPKKYWDMYKRDEIPLADNPYLPKNSPDFAMNRSYELHRSYSDMKGAPMPHEGSFTEEKTRLLKHGYLASVSYIDLQVGRLIDALDKLGLAENTIICLWGDHGWKLGEHNAWCKQTNYEIDTRVPMIFISPKAKGKGKTSNALTEFVDIYPTLCELAGLEVPTNLQGRSLAPLMDNPDAEWSEAAYSQFLRGVFEPLPKGKQYMGYAVRTNNFRYVEWYEWQNNIRGGYVTNELYDHRNDPGENENISGMDKYKEDIKELAKTLRKGFRL